MGGEWDGESGSVQKYSKMPLLNSKCQGFHVNCLVGTLFLLEILSFLPLLCKQAFCLCIAAKFVPGIDFSEAFLPLYRNIYLIHLKTHCAHLF